MRGTRRKDSATLRCAARWQHERAPGVVAMKPPQQPDALHSREILQGLLVAAVRKQLQLVADLRRRRWLVPGLKLHLLPSAKKANRPERERGKQACIQSSCR